MIDIKEIAICAWSSTYNMNDGHIFISELNGAEPELSVTQKLIAERSASVHSGTVYHSISSRQVRLLMA